MRQTIQELVERYQNSLYAVAFNVCKNQQDAEDAVQDTFLQYYNSKKEGSIIFFVGLTLPRYRFSKPSASLDMNLR